MVAPVTATSGLYGRPEYVVEEGQAAPSVIDVIASNIAPIAALLGFIVPRHSITCEARA